MIQRTETQKKCQDSRSIPHRVCLIQTSTTALRALSRGKKSIRWSPRPHDHSGMGSRLWSLQGMPTRIGATPCGAKVGHPVAHMHSRSSGWGSGGVIGANCGAKGLDNAGPLDPEHKGQLNRVHAAPAWRGEGWGETRQVCVGFAVAIEVRPCNASCHHRKHAYAPQPTMIQQLAAWISGY